MSGIDRSKFRSTSVAKAKQVDQETAAMVGGEKGPNADYHKITNGTHYYRLYPPHPSDGGELYAVPKGIHWLPQEVAKKDKQGNLIKDAKGNIEKTIANRPIFNAKIHGGKKKDIIEEYIAFCEKVAKETYPTDEKKRKAYLDPIVGGYDSKYDGILLGQSWVAYADELFIDGENVTKTLGRLEFRKAIRNRLNSIAATESATEPLGTDPFTDPDDGRAISVKYNKDADKPQDYYTTEIFAPVVKGGGGKIQLFPLSDDDLAKFENYPSLKKMFVNSYDRKTFDSALKGLKLFDDEHELGIFAYEEFLDICDELAKEWPTSGEEGEVEEEEGSGDQFDKMDRDELKSFIRENKLGIIVNKNLDDDQVRDAIREVYEPEGKGIEVKTEEEEQEEEEEEGSDKTTPPFKVDKEKKDKEEGGEEKKSAAKGISARLAEAAAKKKAGK